MAKPNTVCVWQGPSVIDGAPIAVLISGFTDTSRNAKNGDMLQTWILRTDIDPVTAIVTGADISICGDCKHRGRIVPETRPDVHHRDGRMTTRRQTRLQMRSCYVAVGKAPAGIWRSFRKGNVPTVAIASLAEAMRTRNLRIGSYGDPAAVPVAVWQELAGQSAGHTGYTHQYRWAGLQGLVMASADTADERADAAALGYRAFRVRLASEPLLPGEITCPASNEAGKRTDCNSCGLCDGTRANDRRKSIAIIAHGIGASSFIKLRHVSA